MRRLRRPIPGYLVLICLATALGLGWAWRATNSYPGKVIAIGAVAFVALIIVLFLVPSPSDASSLKLRFKSSARWNVGITLVTVIAAGAIGAVLANRNGTWAGVGQSLVAAAAVGFFAFLSALFVYLLSHRPYEAMFDAGVQRVFPRGKPGSRWTEQLRDFENHIDFFGKDHSSLFRENYTTLKHAIEGGRSCTFFLLGFSNPYYTTCKPKERKDRIDAARRLYGLKDDLAAKGGRADDRLRLYEYADLPNFSCRMIDEKLIIFGLYLPGVDNPDTLEFEIESGGPMFDTCKRALHTVMETATALARPTPAELAELEEPRK